MEPQRPHSALPSVDGLFSLSQHDASPRSSSAAAPSASINRKRSVSDVTPLHRPALLNYQTIPTEAFLRSSEARGDNFLQRLWSFLMEHERGLNPCIYWSKTRRYLLIPDEKRLVREVAVVLYKQKDYSSFARQLNIYGFRRCSQSQIRELRSKEGIPDGCKVWMHPFLTGESDSRDLHAVQRRASNKKSKSQNGISETWKSPHGRSIHHASTSSSGSCNGREDRATSPAARYVPISHGYDHMYQTSVHARPTSSSSAASSVNYRSPRPRADYSLPAPSWGCSGGSACSQLPLHASFPEVPTTQVESEKVVAAAQLPPPHSLYQYVSAPAFDFEASSETIQLPSRPGSGLSTERKSSLDDLVLATGLR